MSGRIRKKQRWGIGHTTGAKDYCEWYLEVTDEDTGSRVSVSPKIDELSNILKQIVEHEVRNDKEPDRTSNRKRNGDAELKVFDFAYSLLLPLRKDQQIRILSKLKLHLSGDGILKQGRL